MPPSGTTTHEAKTANTPTRMGKTNSTSTAFTAMAAFSWEDCASGRANELPFSCGPDLSLRTHGVGLGEARLLQGLVRPPTTHCSILERVTAATPRDTAR